MMSGSVSATSLTMEITLALDAPSATHEHLAEGTDVYRTWRQRVASEILHGAVQLAWFDSMRLPQELRPICERMANIILEHLPSLCSRLAPQSVGDVLAHKDVPARRKRGRPELHARVGCYQSPRAGKHQGWVPMRRSQIVAQPVIRLRVLLSPL